MEIRSNPEAVDRMGDTGIRTAQRRPGTAPNQPTEIDDHPYLFIAGAPRCGTTTLFDRLAGHRQISPCRVKEPGFLCPREFPMMGFGHLVFEDGMAAYREFFQNGDGVRLEASATYLYTPGVAARIATHFPNGRVLLILREPIGRLLSEYRFAKMLRVIPHGMDFSSYLDWQRQQEDDDPWRPPHLRALTNGRYSRFLKDFLSVLGQERVRVIWTDALRSSPRQTMEQICTFAGVDGRNFPKLRSSPSNASRTIQRPRLYAVWFALEAWRTRRIAAGRRGRLTHLVKRRIARPLLKLSTQPAEKITLSRQQQAFLQDYYADEPMQLESLIGEAPPWANAR